MITLFVWWTNHLDFSRFIHLSLFTGYIWWTELFNNLQAGMILPAVNDYFCYTLTRSWGDISLNSCIFQTTKSENTFFSKLRYVKLMLSFRCFLFFCFQFVSFAYSVQETILCISHLERIDRIWRRRLWWSSVVAFSWIQLNRHLLCSSDFNNKAKTGPKIWIFTVFVVYLHLEN